MSKYPQEWKDDGLGPIIWALAALLIAVLVIMSVVIGHFVVKFW